jgi:hypothetical protein
MFLIIAAHALAFLLGLAVIVGTLVSAVLHSSSRAASATG